MTTRSSVCSVLQRHSAEMEANSARIFALLVFIFWTGVDCANNDKVYFVKPAGTTSIGEQISSRNESAVDLKGPDKECSISLNQTVWYPPTRTCETLLAKGTPLPHFSTINLNLSHSYKFFKLFCKLDVKSFSPENKI